MERMLSRLQDLRVADCMSTKVVPLSARQPMCEAATILHESGVSGAPVVDDHGRCVGILSCHDFLRREARSAEGGASAYARGLVDTQGTVALEIDEFLNDTVSRYMSPAVQTVSADAPLLDAARMMCDCHFHRLPVLDAQGRPLGMITSLDLSAVLVNLVNEALQQTHAKPITSGPR